MSTLFVTTQVDPIDVLASQVTLEMDKCAEVKIISFVCFTMRLFCLVMFLAPRIFFSLIVTNHFFFKRCKRMRKQHPQLRC